VARPPLADIGALDHDRLRIYGQASAVGTIGFAKRGSLFVVAPGHLAGFGIDQVNAFADQTGQRLIGVTVLFGGIPQRTLEL
jgi:hypothetical protein